VGWILGEHEEALRVLDEITPQIHPEEDQSLWSRLQVLRGEMLIVQGNYEAAIQLHELLLKRLNHKSYLDMGPLVLGRVAFSKLELNQFKEAEATARQILDGETEELRESVSWCRGAGSATGVLARIALQKKEYGAARTLYAQSRSYREEAGDPVGASMARVGEGNVSFLEGNLEQAGQIYQDAAGKLTDLGFRFGAGQAYINLSETLLLRGQAEKALASLQSAEETMRMVRSHTNLAEVLRLKSEALLDLGQKPGALSVAHEGMALAENNGLDDFVAVFREKLTLLSSP
jgi:tetratricopeptide (TPR) repeat protein